MEVKRKSLSHVRLLATFWTVAHQASLSMGFPRQEYWSGLQSLLQGIFSTQGSNPGLLHCRWILHYLRHRGRPLNISVPLKFTCSNSNARSDGVRRQGFWEVLQPGGWNPDEMNGIRAYKRGCIDASPFPQARSLQPEKALTWPCWHSALQLRTSRTVSNKLFLLFFFLISSSLDVSKAPGEV